MERPKVQRISDISIDTLIEACEKNLDDYEDIGSAEDQLVYEEAMELVFGSKIWDYISLRLKRSNELFNESPKEIEEARLRVSIKRELRKMNIEGWHWNDSTESLSNLLHKFSTKI